MKLYREGVFSVFFFCSEKLEVVWKFEILLFWYNSNNVDNECIVKCVGELYFVIFLLIKI